jgi:predicted kinase
MMVVGFTAVAIAAMIVTQADARWPRGIVGGTNGGQPMVKLILICGISFAGKSTLAGLIAERFGHAEVDVDVTKVELFGVDVADDALARADWDRMYAETDQRIADHLDAGRTLIDASRNFSRAERDHARQLCRAHGGETVTIFVDTPEEMTR